ncbi:MAG TPA: carotenoid oxygenase family protein [Alphaproteobacteria bacterium]|nr:carotenoid oxygenase family protein [Alphaproteobacteria bacterium]
MLLAFTGCEPPGSKYNLIYHSSHLGRQNLLTETNTIELPVKGNIPAWLKGTLLRNGPSWFGAYPPDASMHWFDGLAMLHGFKFENNKVFYTNKFLETGALITARNEGVFAFRGFATNLYDDLLQNVVSLLFLDEGSPNANVNLYRVAGNYLALTELTPPVQFDKNNLCTIGSFPYQDDLPKANVFESAHPQYDIDERCFYNYIVNFFPQTSYLIYKIQEDSSMRIPLVEITEDKPSYMHSFSITKNYIIFTEYPFKLVDSILFSGKPFIKNYAWDKCAKTKITIINKNCPCDIKTYYADPFFSFHHINAYEMGSNIILNIIAFKDSKIVERLGFFPECLEPSFLLDMKIDLAANTVDSRRISFGGSADLPRINPAYNGRPYRYFYAVKFDKDRHLVMKWDTFRNVPSFWSQEGCFAGEPVFIQNPLGNGKEDDGVILSLVLDANKKSSFLLILDAKNLKELARVGLLFSVPFGLHGQFYK